MKKSNIQKKKKYLDRDISWLNFNHAVLEEASNKRHPLAERLKFIAIYSSNLEEFYRVRVARHRYLLGKYGNKKNKFGYRPSELLREINLIVDEQQKRLGEIFRTEIVTEFASENIHILLPSFSSLDHQKMKTHYNTHLKGNLNLHSIKEHKELRLENQAVYLFVSTADERFLVQLDYESFGRFVVLNDDPDNFRIVQLDDIVRESLKLAYENCEIYALKISRDAELYLATDKEEDIVDLIKKSIRKRKIGLPSRLLFDEKMPFDEINALRKKMNLDMSSLIPGGTYHNFYDYFRLPLPASEKLTYSDINYVQDKRITTETDWFSLLRKEDVMLSYPYQDYNNFLLFLQQVVNDTSVTKIQITLYRVASDSQVCTYLEKALKKGKKVFILAEVKARFDEKTNISWGQRLEKMGATVKYEMKDLKVHAKTLLVSRTVDGITKHFAYLSTGNFNEKTSNIYCDHAILTADKKITTDLKNLFTFIKNEKTKPTFTQLLVAPFSLRTSLAQMIDDEIEHVQNGKHGELTIKVNNLEDTEMIDHLQSAAEAGVIVNLIIRGICCIIPNTPNQKKNITLVRIVDRFLEHTRIYFFNNNGKPKLYLSSADFMTRNLSKRVEVAFPVQDKKNIAILQKELQIQLVDTLQGNFLTKKTNSESQTKSAQEKLPIIIENILQN